MDTKPDLVKNGGTFKIPVGYRFLPTDEELIVHYLNRKIHALPLPAAVVPELDVFQCNPWDLPGHPKEKRYFFCKRNRKVNRCNQISTGSGHWRVIGKEKQVMASGSNQTAIGVRKTLVFYKGKRPHGFRTQWVMHEFRIMSSASTPDQCQKFMTENSEMEDWAVCSIYRKKAKSKRCRAENGNVARKVGKIIKPSSIIDIGTTKDSSDSGPPQPSSSSSSEITEIYSEEPDREKEINHCLHH